MTTDLALTTAIYNGFHPQFKRDLPFPFATTSVDTFLQTMDNCKIVWWELASEDEVQGYSQGSSVQRPERRRSFYPSRSTEWRSQRSGTQSSQPRNERSLFQEGYRGYYQPEDYQRPYVQRSQDEFQQRPMNNQYYQRRQPIAPSPRPKLQIAATSSAGSSKKKQPWAKPPYSNQKQRAYQVESQSEETSFETEWDPDNETHHSDYYGTETNEEAAPEDEYEFAGFISSASSCSHCGKTFKSNNKLHNHLREGCPSKAYYQEPSLPKPRR